jgi:hypothetical protein
MFMSKAKSMAELVKYVFICVSCEGWESVCYEISRFIVFVADSAYEVPI